MDNNVIIDLHLGLANKVLASVEEMKMANEI